MRKILFVTAVLVLGAASITFAEPAPAAGLKLRLVKKSVKVGPVHGGVVKVKCPAGMFAVSGGAWFHRKDHGGDETLSSVAWISGTKQTNKTWSGVGFNNSGEQLLLEGNLQCTTKKLTTSSGAGAQRFEAGEAIALGANCVNGDQIYSYSAYFSTESDGPLDPSLAALARVSSSAPKNNHEWFMAAINQTAGPLYITDSYLCTSKLPMYSLASEADDGSGGGGQVRRAVPVCPGGTRAIAGGAVFNRPGLIPSEADAIYTRLGGSSFLTGGGGWFGYGKVDPPSGVTLRMNVAVLCT